MRKTVLLLILGGLLLTTAGCGSGGGSSSSSSAASTANKSITVSTTIKDVIEQYFTKYFDAEIALNYNKMSSDVLADNENTQLNEAFRKNELAWEKAFSEGIHDYRYEINYQKSSVNGDEITVELILSLDFHYSKALDLDSSYGGVKYSFVLKNNGSNLVITNIDSDLQEFIAFKNQVQEALKQDSALSMAAAIEKVIESRNTQIQRMQSNNLYLKGDSLSTSAILSTPSPTASSTGTEADSTINKSIYVSCRQYKYDPYCAAAYAAKYYNGNSPFYTYYLDCTNFISQCVWAGYVGYGKTIDKTTAATYISKKAGMAYPEWWANTTTTTSTWAGAKALCEYLVTPKTVGPNATTDFPNDYDAKHDYTTITAASIKVGDVIQIWYDSQDSHGYTHSIIITKKEGDSYSQIFYSAHTNPQNDMVFTHAIASSEYMRRLRPASTCYLKTY